MFAVPIITIWKIRKLVEDMIITTIPLWSMIHLWKLIIILHTETCIPSELTVTVLKHRQTGYTCNHWRVYIYGMLFYRNYYSDHLSNRAWWSSPRFWGGLSKLVIADLDLDLDLDNDLFTINTIRYISMACNKEYFMVCGERIPHASLSYMLTR